jgi:hypothetical protein
MRCRRVPRQRIAASLLAVLFTLALTSQQAWAQGTVPSGYRFVQFDAPGSGIVYSGTEAVSINSRGAITGYVVDSGYGTHGFRRDPDGTITGSGANGRCAARVGLRRVGLHGQAES